ncbi:hypothetical protein [Ruegeria lacuscaerulensis]|uniref:hypothetical protein n=1 Tax=Ruegeria lacuscaerulensis TaxID=55218 RepID=UPI003AF7C0B0
MIAAGLRPAIIGRQVGFSPDGVKVQTNSLMTKLRSRTIEQAVARAVSTGILKWTDFFANPVVEIADAERRCLVGGIVNWTSKNNELISFEVGRRIRHSKSFRSVCVKDLAVKFHFEVGEIKKAFGKAGNRRIWVRYL